MHRLNILAGGKSVKATSEPRLPKICKPHKGCKMLQAYERYLVWGLKSMNRSHFAPIEAAEMEKLLARSLHWDLVVCRHTLNRISDLEHYPHETATAIRSMRFAARVSGFEVLLLPLPLYGLRLRSFADAWGFLQSEVSTACKLQRLQPLSGTALCEICVI